MTLLALSRSEWTKQFSTALWWVLLVVLVAYVGLTASALAVVFGGVSSGALGSDSAPAVGDHVPSLLYSSATSVGYVFPLLIGTLMVTSEFRHRTLTPTFLAAPRRGSVLWAKSVVGVAVGVLFGLAALAASTAPAAAILAVFDLDTGLASSHTWAMFARILLAFALWVLIGIGVGALVRNQVGAIVGVLVFTQFLEPIARLAAAFVVEIEPLTRYLPGAAGDTLVGASIFSAAMGAGVADPLPWWAGGLVLLGYAAVLLLIARVTSWRRDVS